MTATMELITERPELATLRSKGTLIASMAERFMGLRIDGVGDKAGAKRVHEARMEVKRFLIDTEKARKAHKEEALRFGQAVDSIARKIVSEVEPIKAHLEAEEAIVDAEKTRIAREAEEARRAALQKRVDALIATGKALIPVAEVERMTTGEFEEALRLAKEEQAERQQQILLADQRRLAEQEAMNAERDRLAAVAESLRAAQESIRLEQQRIADAQAAEARKAELEAARVEAAEQARIATEKRLVEFAKQAAAEELAKEAARIKAEQERPQREKLLAVAEAIKKVPVPFGPGASKVRQAIATCVGSIEQIARGNLT